MKYLKFYLLMFILFLTPSVFAQSINADSYSQADSWNHSSRYDYSTNNTLGDQTNFSIGTIGTRYNGKSYYFQFNFHHSLTANKVYELKVSSTTSDFTSEISKDRIVPLCYNNFIYDFNTRECSNLAVISVIRGSGTQSKDFTIRFSPLTNMTYWGFKFAGGYYNLTGVSNFLINNFDLTEVNATDTDEIINNNNQNTQDIIDNNNQNTQDIINNQNQLFGSECSNLLDFPYTSSNPYSITATSNDYNVNTGKTVYLTSGVSYKYSYGSNKDYSSNTTSGVEFFLLKDGGVSTIIHPSGKSGTFTPSVSGTYALRLDCNKSGDTCTFYNFMISTKTSTYCQYGTQSSKLDETNNAINDTNSYLQDNSNPNISDNEFLSVFNSIGFTDPLQHLLQLPVQFINALVSQSNTCQTINLGTLWGVSLTLPCINLENIIGSTVWGIIDTLMSIGLLVVIVKNLYQTFANLMTMGGEKEAREKFSMPTPMEFLSMILGGDR